MGALALLAVAAVVLAWRSEPKKVERVVLVTIDTLRADHLGFEGYPRDTSPFLDRLAKDSVVFSRAISSSSHTGPSHASMLTSLHPGQHGLLVNGMSLQDGVPAVPEAFAAAGFRTGAFVSVGFLEELRGGFEAFEAGQAEAEEITESAITWLNEVGQDQPLFLWVHYYDVHRRWPKLREGLVPFRDRVLKSAELTGDAWVDFLRDSHGLTLEGSELEDTLKLIDSYDARIAYVDTSLEQLYEAFRRRGFLDGSIWIVTSDHGQGLGSHGALGHGGFLWNEQLRVPLIVHFGDGRYSEKQVDTVVRHLDLLPTLTEIAGVDFRAGERPIEGSSLLPLVRGESDHERFAVSQRRPLAQDKKGEVAVAIQSSTHKYIRLSESEEQFFDLRSDPLEERSLTAEEAAERDLLQQELARVGERLDPELSHLDARKVNPRHLQELKALGYIQ